MTTTERTLKSLPIDAIARLEALISGLQMLLEFLQKNPTMAEKLYISDRVFSLWIYSSSDPKVSKKTFSVFSRLLAKGFGKIKKEYTDSACKVSRPFGPMVNLEVSISRDTVCKRVVVETIEHPQTVNPAWTEEKVKWVCK